MQTRLAAAPLIALAALCATPPAAAAPAPCAALNNPDDRRVSVESIQSADDLLNALERADRGIRTLSAGIQYARDFGDLEGDQRQIWRGTLYFRSLTDANGETEAQPQRTFAVDFDTLILGAQRRDERKQFVFDGQWLVERIPEEKQMIRRQVVPPGERVDPLRLGEGPFPIPIGQQRDDILGRFSIKLLPPEDGWPEGAMPQMFENTWQLRLVPREGTEEARDYSEIRIWYRHEDLLPRMARTVNRDGGGVEVILINIAINQPVPDAVFDTSPPPPDAGWDVQVEPYRRPADQ